MTDLYLWGSYFTPLAYFFFVLWLITPFYKKRKIGWAYAKSDIGMSNIFKRLLLFVVVTSFALTFGSAYRPKNKLPIVKSTYGESRVSMEIVNESPRYESFDKKVKSIEDARNVKEGELFGR